MSIGTWVFAWLHEKVSLLAKKKELGAEGDLEGCLDQNELLNKLEHIHIVRL